MSLLRPLDPNFPIERQLGIETGPVVLVNVFTLDKADEPNFLEVWQDDAAFMKRQPGFISTQLHRALGDSPTYLNYAVWDSTAAFKAAFTHPDFQARSRLTRPPPSPPRIFSGRSRSPASASPDRRRRTAPRARMLIRGGGGRKRRRRTDHHSSGNLLCIVSIRVILSDFLSFERIQFERKAL